MGSSGSGRFGNYRQRGTRGPGSGTGVGMADDSEGKSEIDCPQQIPVIHLEDVATSEYFQTHNSVPSASTQIRLRNAIFRGRLVVEVTGTNEVVGNVPTRHNYLRNCIAKGMTYSGEVISSRNAPLPTVAVTLNA